MLGAKIRKEENTRLEEIAEAHGTSKTRIVRVALRAVFDLDPEMIADLLDALPPERAKGPAPGTPWSPARRGDLASRDA